jgi:hypothetical protein
MSLAAVRAAMHRREAPNLDEIAMRALRTFVSLLAFVAALPAAADSTVRE